MSFSLEANKTTIIKYTLLVNRYGIQIMTHYNARQKINGHCSMHAPFNRPSTWKYKIFKFSVRRALPSPKLSTLHGDLDDSMAI